MLSSRRMTEESAHERLCLQAGVFVIKASSKVATGIIAGLKGQPLALALLVVNAMFLGVMVFIVYELKGNGERKDTLIREMVQDCMGVRK